MWKGAHVDIVENRSISIFSRRDEEKICGRERQTLINVGVAGKFVQVTDMCTVRVVVLTDSPFL